MLLGFNHYNPSVRSFCLYKAMNEMHLNLSTISKSVYSSSDIVHGEINYGQGLLVSSHVVANEHQHKDLFRLSEIAFGECDFHIRLNAIQQLSVLLVKDSEGYLLSTIDQKWSFSICLSCLKFIQSYDWYTSLTINNEAESSLFSLQTIILLRNILLAVPSLRNALSISKSSINTEDSLNITPLVTCILKYRLTPYRSDLFDKSTVPFDPRHMDLFHLICYEIIFIYSSSLYDSSFWKKNYFNEKISFDYPESNMKNGSAYNLLLPSFLCKDIFCVSPGQDLHFLYQKYVLPICSTSVSVHIDIIPTHHIPERNNLEVILSEINFHNR